MTTPALPSSPLTVTLPIADRRASKDFYADALGLVAIGEPVQDGVPEPLQFQLAAGVRLVLIPTGGFGWVIGDRQAARPGHVECVLGLEASTPDELDAVLARALAAGARSVVAASDRSWGYSAIFADPDGHLWELTCLPASR